MTDTTQPDERQSETVEQHDDGSAKPKMPHEHDESASSQDSEPRDIMKQAKKDIDSGQEDTDLRGTQGRREPSVPPSRG